MIQIEDRVENGSWHIQDGSWVLRCMLAVHALGVPALAAVEWTAAVLASLCVPAGWWLGWRLGGGRSAWVVALWAAASPTLSQLAGDFPKNLGIAPTALALAAALATPGRARWLAAPLALALVTAHRTGAGLAALAFTGALLGLGLRRAPGLLLVGGALLCGAALLDLGGVIGVSDLARLEGALQPTLPSGLFGYTGLRAIPSAQLLEWSLSVLLLLALARPDTPLVLRGAVAVPLAVVTLAPWRTDVLDLGYRLTLLAPLVAAPALAVVSRGPAPRWLPAVALMGCTLSPLGLPDANIPPWQAWADALARVPRRPPLLIAHRGLALMHDHLYGGEAMAWAPEPELDRAHVGRVTWGIRGSWWLTWGQGHRVPLGGAYAYVEEADWEVFVTNAQHDDEVRAVLDDWRNPMEVRPAWLVRGR